MSSDSIEYGRLHQDGHEACRVHAQWPEGLEGQVEGGGGSGGREWGGGAVKTMITFHQVRPIFYSSLKQSNLQKDNYALAPFYLLEGERCQGLIAVSLPASTSANYPLSALVRHHGWIGQSINLPPPLIARVYASPATASNTKPLQGGHMCQLLPSTGGGGNSQRGANYLCA